MCYNINMPTGVYKRTEECLKAHRYYKLTEEHKKNISKGKKGIKFPNRKSPIPFTEEHIRKMSDSHRGDRSNLWKGNKMSFYPENERIRKSIEYKLFRKVCLERDNFTDAKTGQRGGRLVVHHINNFADYPELRLAIDNGITLSKESHELFHKIYGKNNNTKEQLYEFLCKN